jgi:hypothetical protein
MPTIEGCDPGRADTAIDRRSGGGNGQPRTGARLTATNEGSRDAGAFYSNIDHMGMDALPADAWYFHAQYRQAVPNVAP